MIANSIAEVGIIDTPALSLSRDDQPARRSENGTNDEGHPTNGEKGDDDTLDRDT